MRISHVDPAITGEGNSHLGVISNA